jgi:hAT family C-terminal dimerisation region
MFETAEESEELATVHEEYESYVKGPLLKPGTNILQFWSMSDLTLLTIYSIAMDYLPIQVSSVLSERVFSSSAKTDTHKRNCIHPLLMEALQMLKFGLKKSRLDFMTGWAVNEASMLDVEEEEVDLLGSLFEGDREMAFDALIAAMGEGDDGDNA